MSTDDGLPLMGGGPGPSEDALRQEIVEVARLCYARNLVTVGDGNISVRLDSAHLLLTPSGVFKAAMRPEDILVVDMTGRRLSGAGRPSSEVPAHLAVYRRRPDAWAVIHAHPPIATALTVAGVDLERCILPEVVLALGRIVVAPYATPGSDDLVRALDPLVARADAILLERHGSLTVGRTLLEAYSHLERIEHAAQVIWNAQVLRHVLPLPEGEVQRLLELRARIRQGQGNP